MRMGDPTETIRRASMMPGQILDSLSSHRLSMMPGQIGAGVSSHRLYLAPKASESHISRANGKRSADQLQTLSPQVGQRRGMERQLRVHHVDSVWLKSELC